MIGDDIIVAAYSTALDWMTINERPFNYYFFGAMGLASSHAIGLALAFPERKIIVLDGDGSLLMNLSTLVTMASLALPNLYYSVWHNGSYEANGGHPLPSPHVNFCGLARSAGFNKAMLISTPEEFHQLMPQFLQMQGLCSAEIIIDQGRWSRAHIRICRAAPAAMLFAPLCSAHQKIYKGDEGAGQRTRGI